MVRISLPAQLLCTLTGCSSVAWQEGGPPETWRGVMLRRAEVAHVAAHSESAAAEVYRSYEAVREVLRRVGATLPSPPLLLAVDAGEQPLLGDATRTLERVMIWHQQQVCAGAAEPARTAGLSALPMEVLTPMARAVAGAVPLDAAELDLPATWRAGVRWCLVVPTEECCEAAADAVLDYGFDKADLSFGAWLLMAPFMPWVRSEARGQLRAQLQRQVLEGALAAARREGSVPPDALSRGLSEMGVDLAEPSRLVPRAPGGEADPLRLEAALRQVGPSR